MDVYIEAIYIIHFMTLLLSLETMLILLNQSENYRDLLKKSLILSSSIIMLYIDLGWIYYFVWTFLFYSWYKRMMIRYFICFMAIYLSIVYFNGSILEAFVFNGLVLFPTNQSIYYPIFYTLICGVLIALCFMTTKQKISQQNYYTTVECFYQNQRFKWEGFMDSGNNAYYHGNPLIFIKKIDKVYTTIGQLEVNGVVIRNLDLILIDEMILKNQKYTKVYACIDKTLEYDCLLHHEYWGG